MNFNSLDHVEWSMLGPTCCLMRSCKPEMARFCALWSVRNYSAMRGIVLIAAVLLSSLTGCKEKQATETSQVSKHDTHSKVDAGRVIGSTYSNSYFGFQVTFPKDWSIQDHEAQLALGERGKKMLAGNDKKLDQAIEAAEATTLHLFAAFEFPLGTPPPNPSILGTAENLQSNPQIKKATDYLLNARKLLEMGQVEVAFPGPMQNTKISGVGFDVLPLTIKIGAIQTHQKIYTTIRRGYALSLILTYVNPEEESALQAILKSVSFSNEIE